MPMDSHLKLCVRVSATDTIPSVRNPPPLKPNPDIEERYNPLKAQKEFCSFTPSDIIFM